jgi:hypothetical protein
MGRDDNTPPDNGDALDLYLNDLPTKEDYEFVSRWFPSLARKAQYKNRVNPNLAGESPLPFKTEFPPFPLFSTIREYLETHDKWERQELNVNPQFYAQHFSKYLDHSPIIGDHSLTDKKCKIKKLIQYPYTSTEIATSYIRLCEEEAKEILRTKYSKHKDRNKSGPTIYFGGRYQGELGYIDLKQAYWQILSPTTLDMEYIPDLQEIVSQGFIPYIQPDEFGEWREVRLILNSLFNYRELSVWDIEKQRIIHQIFPSSLYRPFNLSYILDIMNAVFIDCMDNFPGKIHQWLTDAPIVSGEYTERIRDFLWTEWGFHSRIEAWGNGDSKSQSVYKIEAGHGLPEKITKHYYSSRPLPKNNKKFPSANIENLKLERWALLNKIRDISPLAPRIKRFYGWKQIEIQNAIPMGPISPRINNSSNSNRLTREQIQNAIPMGD